MTGRTLRLVFCCPIGLHLWQPGSIGPTRHYRCVDCGRIRTRTIL